jgi:hypothetical protein
MASGLAIGWAAGVGIGPGVGLCFLDVSEMEDENGAVLAEPSQAGATARFLGMAAMLGRAGPAGDSKLARRVPAPENMRG